MATASSSWMPAQGRHNVGIGSSLAKALKARKGQPPQRNKNLPERDFYSLRCAHLLTHPTCSPQTDSTVDNHKPASIDPAKPGTLEVNPGREVTAVRVERPTAHVRNYPRRPTHHPHAHVLMLFSLQDNEVVVFKGEEKPAKEWDCVLIYDEATQTFTLEKLDSLVNLNFDGKAQPRTRPTPSRTFPFPHTSLLCPHLTLTLVLAPAASTSTQTPQRSPARTAADELEAQLEGGRLDTPDGDDDADADGEPDPSFPPARTAVEELEDGEEEEEDGEVPLARTVQLKKTTTPRARPVQPKATAPPMQPPPPQTQEREPAQSAKNRPTPASVKKSVPTGTKARTSAAHAQPPKPPRAAKPPAASPTTAAPAPSAKRAAASSAATAERRLPDDVEDFEIRGPIAPSNTTKRGGGAASAPPPPPPVQPSFSLALPTASGPDPLAHHQGLYNGTAESDDEWDEILAQPDRAQPSHHHHHHHHHHHGTSQVPSSLTITIEDEADDGLDFLERELLGEDEPMVDVDGDGDGDADGDEEGDEDMEELMLTMLEEVAPTPRPGGGGAGAGPMSMNQFVGGSIAVEDEDDEYSSSEESDED
jgi:hypothetical protein